MATNFFSRWSQRKLDESTDESQETEQTLEITESSSEISSGQSNASSEIEQVDTEASTETTLSSAGAEEATDVQGLAPEEDVSVAQLLVSEASESVKKAALRKLFLSEEFNVRDGLDDYDDDYSNLKSLSEGVAETLRDWVKDKTEEETAPEEEQVIDNKHEGEVLEQDFGASFDFFTDASPFAAGDFVLASFNLIANSEGLTSFSLTDFWNPAAFSDYNIAFSGTDSINVSAIPEPTSIALLMLAGCALISTRRKVK